MYYLFECGICTSLYQIQIEKISALLQKVICPSCQTFHYLGPVKDDKSLPSPTIEKLVLQNDKIPPIDPKLEQRSILKDLSWECGICESKYQFNLNKVTSQGIKITCTTCFNFFVLQKIGILIDLDQMIMQEMTKDKTSPQPQRKTDQPSVLPPMMSETDLSKEISMPISAPLPPKPPASTVNIKPLATPQAPKYKKFPDPPILKPQPMQQPVVKKMEEFDIPLGDPDLAAINSFKSFSIKKKEFKLDKQHEATFVTFVDEGSKITSRFANRIVALSYWFAGVCALALAIIFAYEHFIAKPRLEKEIEKQDQTETSPARDPQKPRYGFPQLSE